MLDAGRSSAFFARHSSAGFGSSFQRKLEWLVRLGEELDSRLRGNDEQMQSDSSLRWNDEQMQSDSSLRWNDEQMQSDSVCGNDEQMQSDPVCAGMTSKCRAVQFALE